MLRSLDSCTEVAIAIVAARAGMYRRTATAAMIAALLAWSGSISVLVPDAVAVQCSRTGTSPTVPFHQAQAAKSPPVQASTKRAVPIRALKRPDPPDRPEPPDRPGARVGAERIGRVTTGSPTACGCQEFACRA